MSTEFKEIMGAIIVVIGIVIIGLLNQLVIMTKASTCYQINESYEQAQDCINDLD